MSIKDITAKEYIVAYKGFDNELKCRDFEFEFEIGKTYEHKGEVIPYESGFHSCEYPLDVLKYYGPTNNNRFAIVEASGEIVMDNDNHKIASSILTVKEEIDLHELVHHAVDWVMQRLDESIGKTVISGNCSVSTNTGNYSVSANTGERCASINTGDYSASRNTGNRSVSTNTGDRSVSTNTGNHSASTNTGDWSIATNTGNRSVTTNIGTYSTATNMGKCSAAINIGDRSDVEVTGSDSIAASFGIQGRARANAGGAIVLCYRDEKGHLIHIRASKVGENGIKEGVWYALDANGQFIEVDNN